MLHLIQIFTGINDSSPMLTATPLLEELEVVQKYKDFFLNAVYLIGDNSIGMWADLSDDLLSNDKIILSPNVSKLGPNV